MKVIFDEKKFRETVWAKLVIFLAVEGKFDYTNNFNDDKGAYIQWLSWMEKTWSIQFKFKNNNIQDDVEEVDIQDEYYTLLLLRCNQ
jgi:hypothetical protein